VPAMSPPPRCALTAPFHHYLPASRQAVSFCCTFRRITPPWGYQAPCPVQFGLSSPEASSRRDRSGLTANRTNLLNASELCLAFDWVSRSARPALCYRPLLAFPPHFAMLRVTELEPRTPPSCWSQPFAPRIDSDCSAFDTWHSLLYTDHSMVDIECLALSTDCSVFHASRLISRSDCSLLDTYHSASHGLLHALH